MWRHQREEDVGEGEMIAEALITHCLAFIIMCLSGMLLILLLALCILICTYYILKFILKIIVLPLMIPISMFVSKLVENINKDSLDEIIRLNKIIAEEKK